MQHIHNQIENYTFTYLCGLFTMIVIGGNIFALKIIEIAGFITPAGMICFPFTYSLGDMITELYGYAAARKVILFSLLNLLIFVSLLKFVVHLPPSPTWLLNDKFNDIFSMSTRLLFGTVGAYLAGELLNSKILSILKYITQGRLFYTRSIVATLIGVTIDTIVFNLISFIGIIGLMKLLPFIMGQYILKLFFIFFGSFIANIIIHKIKKTQKKDPIDKYSYKWIDKYKSLYSKTVF